MSLNIATIRTALKTQLATALNASTQPLNVYDYPPDTPSLNALLILPAPSEDGKYIHYHGTFGPNSQCTIGLRLELRVDGGQIDAAKQMDLYLSSGNAESVTSALEADVTLSGAVGNIYGAGWTTPAWFRGDDGVKTWYAATFDLDIRKAR